MRMMKNKLMIEPEFFGKARYIDIKKELKTLGDEIFFTIERRNDDGSYNPDKKYGYIEITPKMKDFFEHDFFTGCGGIQFIQWTDSWNVVFEEKSIIGSISFGMTFDDFDKLFADVKEEDISVDNPSDNVKQTVTENSDDIEAVTFGQVIWSEQDIIKYLDEHSEFPADKEFCKDVINRCVNDNHFTDTMIEAGWLIIANHAQKALKAWEK